MDTITKTIKLSATLRQFAGAKIASVDVLPDATVRDLLQALRLAYPLLGERAVLADGTLQTGIQMLIDGRHIDFLQGVDTPIAQAEDVLLIPPIAGG